MRNSNVWWVSVCTSSSEMEVAVVQHHQDLLQLTVEYARHKRRRRRMKLAISVKPWNGRRRQFGLYDQLMVEMRNEDQRAFRNFLRIPPEMHDELSDRVGPNINILDTGNPWSLD